MDKIKNFFKKIKNWLIFGEFINLYIVTYKCDNKIGTIVVKSNSKTEAAYTAAIDLKNKYNCLNVTIIEIYEY